MDDIDMNRIFEQMFGNYESVHREDKQKFHSSGFGSDYGSGFGFTGDSARQGFGRRAKQRQAADYTAQNMTANITVSKKEASVGCDKVITIRRPKTSRLQIHIPAGIKEGQKIRLKGKGHLARDGMPDGDLFLKVHIA